MKTNDYADRSWLIGIKKQNQETKTVRKIIILTLATFAVWMAIIVAVAVYLDKQPTVTDDFLLSPDMVDFIESGKAGMISEEDTE
jgi:hypothetical protein